MSSCGVLGGLAIQRGVDACEYQERSRLRLAVLWSFVCRRASLDNTKYLRQCKKLCIHPIQRYHQFWSYPSSQRMSSKMRSGCIPVLASIVYFPQPRARVLAGVALLVTCSLLMSSFRCHFSTRSTTTAATSASPCPVDCCPTTRKTDTATPCASRSEHGGVPIFC